MNELEVKAGRLLEQLRQVPSLVVAYSGGVDSAYLAYAAHQALGDRMLAVTALSASRVARDAVQVTYASLGAVVVALFLYMAGAAGE